MDTEFAGQNQTLPTFSPQITTRQYHKGEDFKSKKLPKNIATSKHLTMNTANQVEIKQAISSIKNAKIK